MLKCCCQSFLKEHGRNPPCSNDLVVWCGRVMVHVWLIHCAIVLVMVSRFSHTWFQCWGNHPIRAIWSLVQSSWDF